MEFDKSKTKQNLAKAYAGESQARGRYEFLAERLREEGYYELSKVILSLTDQELAHSKVFFDLITKNAKCVVMNIDIEAGYPFKKGGLVDTINYAVEDEIAEFETIYPSFADVAEKEGYLDIAETFRRIAAIERLHGNVLGEIAMKMNTDQFYTSKEKRTYKCTNCGHEQELNDAWQICPVCQHPRGFVQITLDNKY